MKTSLFSFTTVVAIFAVSFLSGCGGSNDSESTTPSTQQSDTQTEESDHGHAHAGHGAGPHDGTLADWGGGKYHVEFTVNHDKKEATVYILGSDEKTPEPIKTENVLLSISDPSIQAELVAVPLEGEAEGTSSRFVGTHDNLSIVQEYQGTISGQVDGTPYVGEFKEEPHDHEE